MSLPLSHKITRKPFYSRILLLDWNKVISTVACVRLKFKLHKHLLKACGVNATQLQRVNSYQAGH